MGEKARARTVQEELLEAGRSIQTHTSFLQASMSTV